MRRNESTRAGAPCLLGGSLNAGREELLATRKEWLLKNGRAKGANARHAKGWTAEKLAAR